MQTKDDNYYMQKAIDLAKKAEGYTSPNPLVGAVVVKNNDIVGEGYHQYAGGPHAEVYALDEAGEKAKGATLYVNLEPCSHYGKTPPCSLKVIQSGVDRVVVGMKDPNPKVAGRGLDRLRKEGIDVEVGVLAEKAQELNEVFIKYITSEYPFIYLKSAQTLDGYIATKTGDSKWITNEKARKKGHELRNKVDAILVGSGTVLSDNPRLTTRLPEGEGKDSIRVLLDPQLKVPLEARIFNPDSKAKTLIIISNKIEKNKKKPYRDLDKVELIELPLDKNKNIPLSLLLKTLHEREITSILVEGGGKINHSFLKAGLVDKIYTFIAPRILGGNDGISVYNGTGPESMKNIKELKNVQYKTLGDNILVIGKY